MSPVLPAGTQDPAGACRERAVLQALSTSGFGVLVIGSHDADGGRAESASC